MALQNRQEDALPASDSVRIQLSILETLPQAIILVGSDQQVLWANRVGRGFNPERILPGLLGAEPAAGRFNLHRLDQLADQSVLYWLEDVQTRQRQEEEYRRLQKAGALFQISPGLGHDLKNRLTGVVGNLSLTRLALEEGRGGHEVIDAVRDAERAALEADSLVQRFMLFTHNDALSRTTLDLQGLVENAGAVALGGSNKRIQLSQLDTPWPLKGNPGQLQQAIQNLLQNAAEAMGGAGTIRVEFSNYRQQNPEPGQLPPEGTIRMGAALPGDYVCLRVSDEGQGILARDLKRIFEPFFTRKPERQGLGLTVTESVIRNHGGYMEVESQAGHGTNVSLFLPIDNPDPAVRHDRLQRPAKILVMDDEEMVRDVWERMLSRLGHRCSFAAEGGEALFLYQTARYSDHPFDLVILDMLVAKGMGAIETIERLKAIDPAVRTVISSGYTQDPLMLRSTEFGFKAALPKPFNLTQLQRLIQDLLE